MEGYRLDWESGSGGQGRNRELWHLGMCRSWLHETEMNNNLGRMNITHESSGLGRNFFQELKKKKRGWKVVSKEWFHVIEISRNPLATPPPRSHSCYSSMLWHHCEVRRKNFLPHTIYPRCSAVSDGSGRTATGTICIEVPDVTDYCPVVLAESHYICIASPSTLISARDVGDHSYGSPYTFCVVDQPPGTADMWDMEPVNGKWNANLLIFKTKNKHND